MDIEIHKATREEIIAWYNKDSSIGSSLNALLVLNGYDPIFPDDLSELVA